MARELEEVCHGSLMAVAYRMKPPDVDLGNSKRD